EQRQRRHAGREVVNLVGLRAQLSGTILQSGPAAFSALRVAEGESTSADEVGGVVSESFGMRDRVCCVKHARLPFRAVRGGLTADEVQLGQRGEFVALLAKGFGYGEQSIGPGHSLIGRVLVERASCQGQASPVPRGKSEALAPFPRPQLA